MKLALFCIFLVTVSSSSAGSNEGTNCLQEYLRQKGKLGIEFPAVEWNLRCRFITTTALRVLNNSIESKITNGIPVMSVSCLIKEFNNQEVADVIFKLQVIKKSELSENERQNLANETTEELLSDLASVANKCETDQNKFIQIFLEYFGTKRARNETLSAREHNYCFAQYAADNYLLPLENIELNPYGIDTRNVNCNAIIREEQERQEEDLRNKLKTQQPSVVECIVKEYKNQNLFQSQISALVLSYYDLPQDVEERETEKVEDMYRQVALIGFLCAVADSESNYN